MRPLLAPVSLTDAIEAANKLLEIIRPYCERVQVAGSVRRMQRIVGDIEIVAQPRMIPEPGQMRFLDPPLVSHLDVWASRLRTDDLVLDRDANKNGPKYKRLIWQGRTAVDLFIVRPPASWGAIFALRTGPADFSKLCVTKRSEGGAMPNDLRQSEGALWRGLTRIETANEQDWFAELGVPCWPASERNAKRLMEHVRSLRQR